MNPVLATSSSQSESASHYHHALTSSNQQTTTTIKSSIDELRLITVMLRSFSKSKNGQNVAVVSSSPSSSQFVPNQNAALANILEHRFGNSLQQQQQQKSSSSMNNNTDLDRDNSDSQVLNQTLEGKPAIDRIASDLMSSSTSIDAGMAFSGVTTPRAAQHHSQQQQGKQEQGFFLNNNHITPTREAVKKSNAVTSGGSVLNFKSFFPTQEEVFEHQKQQQNGFVESSSNPQLDALADRVAVVMNNLKSLLMTNNNNEHTNNNTTTATRSLLENNNNVNSSNLLSSTSNENIVALNNNNNNAKTDHRKLFPRSSPGWTRRVEPSIIDRYAKEQQQKQQQQLHQNNNNSSIVLKPTPPTTIRAPLIGPTTTSVTHPQTTTTNYNNNNNNNTSAPQNSGGPTAPLHHAQTLLNNAPTTDLRNAMELQELTQATSASMYMVLRACAVQLRAESASVFVYFGGEMICCACVGAGAVFPPCSMRFASGGSLAHAVLTSGVALHRTVRQDVNSFSSTSGSGNKNNNNSSNLHQQSRKGSSVAERVDIRGRRRSLIVDSSSSSSELFQQQQQQQGVSSASSSTPSAYPVQDTLMMPVLGAFGGIQSINENELMNARKAKQQQQKDPNPQNTTLTTVTSGRRKSSVAFNMTSNQSPLEDQSEQQQQQQQTASSSPNLVTKPTCRAVLQLQNKNRGTAAFTQVDETKAAYFADLIGYLMHLGDTANLDFRTTSYDPVGVQRSVPFIPANALPSLRHQINTNSNSNALAVMMSELQGSEKQQQGKEGGTFFLSSSLEGYSFGKQQQQQTQSNLSTSSSGPNTNITSDLQQKNMITKYFEDFEPRRYIHRSDVDSSRHGAEAGSGVARRALLGQAANEVGPAPSLREIDSYVSNLRDCWSRAVDETVSANLESTSRVQQIRDLKTELEKSRGETARLSELLQLERFSAGDYVAHYDELRSELENFLEKRTAGSEEAFSWTSQNLIGGGKKVSE